MKNFALIGASGYIAPRHFKAIKETNNIDNTLDPFDSVGIIDSYFPKANFTEPESFDRHIEKIKNNGVKLDYVSICSPNYLHDAQKALRWDADALCEKPLVLNPWNLDALKEMEKNQAEKRTVLQLRLHQTILELKKKLKIILVKKFDVDLTYLTSRGNWYILRGKET